MIFPHRRTRKSGSLNGTLAMSITAVLMLMGTLLPGWSIAEAFMRGWPLFVIGAGFASLVKNVVQAPFRGRFDLLGPVIVLTIGGLFALDTLMGIRFHTTWPLLLVVIAVGFVLKKLLVLPFLPFVRRRL